MPFCLPTNNIVTSDFNALGFIKSILFLERDNNMKENNTVNIRTSLTVTAATISEAHFVSTLYIQNKDALKTENISLNVWKKLLSAKDPDEKHFLIYNGDIPVAYMKINGLLNSKQAWISMLFVSKDFQRQGIGTFAIEYAEKYVREMGFDTLCIQTDVNNISAINCYLKSGYQIYENKSKIKFRKTL